MTKRAGLTTTKVVNLCSGDVIQVPVEDCLIVDISAVPSQMYDRKQKLFKVKVSPKSGPWSNCEGEFIIGSMEDMVVVEKYQPPSLLSRLCSSLSVYFFGRKQTEVKALPQPEKVVLYAPPTHSYNGQWT